MFPCGVPKLLFSFWFLLTDGSWVRYIEDQWTPCSRFVSLSLSAFFRVFGFEFSHSLDVKTHTFFSFSLLNKEVYLVLLAHSLTRSLIHSLTVGTPYKNVSYFRVHVRFHYLGRCRRRKLPATTSDWLSLCIYIMIQTESVKREKGLLPW